MATMFTWTQETGNPYMGGPKQSDEYWTGSAPGIKAPIDVVFDPSLSAAEFPWFVIWPAAVEHVAGAGGPYRSLKAAKAAVTRRASRTACPQLWEDARAIPTS